MKELLLGLGLVLVVGFVGFAYRVIIEQPQKPQNAQACTQEAKVCPDGTSVGRTGPACAFAPCPPPNMTIPAINATLALPEGYALVPQGKTNSPDYIASFSTNTLYPSASFITIRKYPIPAGKDFKSVLLGETVFGASGENAKSMDAFKKITIGGRDYYSIGIERFEGVVSSSYYLPEDTDVLRFDVVEHDVQNWTDQNLDVDGLPAHKALIGILQTIQL